MAGITLPAVQDNLVRRPGATKGTAGVIRKGTMTPYGKGVDRGLGTRIQQQKTLIAHGYRIGPATGDNSQPFQMAWKNYQAALAKGLHPQSAAAYWNKNSKFALNMTSSDSNGPHRGTGLGKPGSSTVPKYTTTTGNPTTKPAAKPKASGKPARSAPLAAQGPDMTQAALKAARQTGAPDSQALPLSLAQMGTIPTRLAAQIAGLQYGPQIADLTNQQHQNVSQFAQNLADIQNWYQQVQASQHTAAARDQAMGHAAQGSLQDAVQGIIASLGGGANQGGGTVGAAGANDLGTLQALATNQDQYNSDLAPILQLAQTGAASSEKARQSKVAADLASQLSAAKGAQGAAQAAEMEKILQYNQAQGAAARSNQLKIRQYNNQLAQQNFANQLAQQNAQVAALLSGARAQSYVTTANAKAAKATQTAKPKPAKGSFAGTTAYDRQQIASHIVGGLYDPTSGQKLNVTPAQALNHIRAGVAKLGWSLQNPEVQSWAQGIYQGWLGG